MDYDFATIRSARIRRRLWALALTLLVIPQLPSLASGQDSLSDLVEAQDTSQPAIAWPAGSFELFPSYYDLPANRPLTLRTEFVHWWIDGNPVPSLVTTSPTGTPPLQAGVLGQLGTSTLYGADSIDEDPRSGFRATLTARLAHWFDRLAGLELETHYSWVEEQQASNFFAASLGDPILARPFFNVLSSAQESQLIAYPGDFEGDIAIATPSRLDSAGILLRRNWWSGRQAWVDMVAGYRYVRFREELSVQAYRLNPDDPTVLPQNTLLESDTLDNFSVWNEFHGGEFGLVTYVQRCPFTVEILAKVAVGNVHQILSIFGHTEEILRGPDPAPGDARVDTLVERDSGLLALPSNIGRYSVDRIGIVPEFGINLRCDLTRTFSAIVGYQVMAVSEMLRTGDQIDTSLNLAQVGTPLRPQVSLSDRLVWVQGINLGVEW